MNSHLQRPGEKSPGSPPTLSRALRLQLQRKDTSQAGGCRVGVGVGDIQGNPLFFEEAVGGQV